MHNPTQLIESANLLQAVPDRLKSHQVIESAARTILLNVGEDPDREGLRKTPQRVARMYDELLAGYSVEPLALINDATFEGKYDQMVILKDIDFYSLCEHHLLTFFGRVHIGYLPSSRSLLTSEKICETIEL